jgi:uncharacterized protein
LDTSALIKLLIEEAGAAEMVERIVGEDLATSNITYVEACAALATAIRVQRIGDLELAGALETLDQLWSTVVRISVSDALIRNGAALALRHSLRGYDAVQLASAISTAARGPTTLATWDRDLSRAARVEGLSIFPE